MNFGTNRSGAVKKPDLETAKQVTLSWNVTTCIYGRGDKNKMADIHRPRPKMHCARHQTGGSSCDDVCAARSCTLQPGQTATTEDTLLLKSRSDLAESKTVITNH